MRVESVGLGVEVARVGGRAVRGRVAAARFALVGLVLGSGLVLGLVLVLGLGLARRLGAKSSGGRVLRIALVAA